MGCLLQRNHIKEGMRLEDRSGRGEMGHETSVGKRNDEHCVAGTFEATIVEVIREGVGTVVIHEFESISPVEKNAIHRKSVKKKERTGSSHAGEKPHDKRIRAQENCGEIAGGAGVKLSIKDKMPIKGGVTAICKDIRVVAKIATCRYIDVRMEWP
eukprot:Gb_17036 [translate_table: standard]